MGCFVETMKFMGIKEMKKGNKESYKFTKQKTKNEKMKNTSLFLCLKLKIKRKQKYA